MDTPVYIPHTPPVLLNPMRSLLYLICRYGYFAIHPASCIHTPRQPRCAVGLIHPATTEEGI